MKSNLLFNLTDHRPPLTCLLYQIFKNHAILLLDVLLNKELTHSEWVDKATNKKQPDSG